MKKMLVNLTQCFSCPHRKYYGSHSCYHESVGSKRLININTIPGWCPLEDVETEERFDPFEEARVIIDAIIEVDGFWSFNLTDLIDDDVLTLYFDSEEHADFVYAKILDLACNVDER